MAREDIIARRYARALAEYAGEESRMDEVRRDLALVSGVADPASGEGYAPELLEFLLSPVVTPADKEAALDGILSKLGVGESVSNFMKVLLKRNRIGLLPHVARSFDEIAGGIAGEYTAVVHTARPLTRDQRQRMARALSDAFGRTVHLHQQVEPGLLAGARVTVAGKTFDGTVLGRLHELKHRLMRSGETDLERLDEEEAADATA